MDYEKEKGGADENMRRTQEGEGAKVEDWARLQKAG